MWYTSSDSFIGPLLHGAGLGIIFPVFAVLLLIWSFAWKAIGLWHAARHGQRVWFVALLVLNTLGILEIVYLKWYAKSAGAGREHVFPFLKDVKRELVTRVSSSASANKKS